MNNWMEQCQQGVNANFFVNGFGEYHHFFRHFFVSPVSHNIFMFNLMRDLLLLFNRYNKKIRFF